MRACAVRVYIYSYIHEHVHMYGLKLYASVQHYTHTYIHIFVCAYTHKEVYGPALGTSESEDRNPRQEAHRRTQQRSSDSRACSIRRGRQA